MKPTPKSSYRSVLSILLTRTWFCYYKIWVYSRLVNDLVSSIFWVSLLRLSWIFLRIVANPMYFPLRSNSHVNIAIRFWLLLVYVVACFVFDLDLFSSFLVLRLSDCLWMLLFFYARLHGVWSLLLRIYRVCRSSARQVTLWSYSFIPSFYYALVLPHK